MTAAQQTAFNKAVAALGNQLKGLANPENYVTVDDKNRATTRTNDATRDFISGNLGLDPSQFSVKGGGYNLNLAKLAQPVKDAGLDYTNSILKNSSYAKANVDFAIKYKNLGVTDLNKIFDKGKPSEPLAQEAVIRDVYKLDPAKYKVSGTKRVPVIVNGKQQFNANGSPKYASVPNNTFALNQAKADYEYNLPKITLPKSKPSNFIEAAKNYQQAVDRAITIGVDTLNESDRATLREAGKQVRLYKSEAVGGSAQALLDNINRAEDALNALDTQRARVAQTSANLSTARGERVKIYRNELDVDSRELLNLTMQIRQGAPRISESVQALDFNDVKIGSIGAASALGSGSPSPSIGSAANLTTGATTAGATTSAPAPGSPAAISASVGNLAANNLFGTSTPIGKDAPQDEVDKAIIGEYNTVLDREIGAANTALATAQTRLANINAKLGYATPGTPNYTSLAAQADEIKSDITSLTDTLSKATALKTKGFTVTDNDRTQYRKIIGLSEQNALDLIGKIDPDYLSTSRGLSSQYKSLVDSPLGPTQDDRTEAMRGMIEDEAMNQLRLGSTLDESVRREVEQAARGAQAARGNIFGVAPAVEEAMATGLMGEQRKAQRYGAAAAFLGSGQTRGDSAARDLALRQSLNLSRLGAANEFLAGGANPYNIANQYVSNQRNAFNNYIAANLGASVGFTPTTNQNNPFMFVDPNAGLQGAQTSASIYNTMQNATASMYGSQVGAIANSYQSPASAFGAVAQGLGNLFSFKI